MTIIAKTLTPSPNFKLLVFRGVGLAHIKWGQTYVAMPLTYQVTLWGSEQIIKLFIWKTDQQCYRKVCRNSGDMYMTGNR